MAIKISGILKDGMGRPIPKCTIELLCKKTSLTVVVETEARMGLEITGSYDLHVEPGQYDVSLYIVGFPPKRVGEIQVYSDSIPGTLNDFLMMPGESDLTPELVLIFQQLRDEARQAANEAKADKELADSILTDVITVQADVNEKQQQVNTDMIEAGKSKTASAASAKAAFDDAGKTAADVATVAGLKANTETAAQQAEISNVSASGYAGRAEAAANSVKTLTASADTLAPGVNATAQWNPATNNLLVGIPSGLKGDKGDKGEQGIQGIQGQQGIQGIKGDKGDTGPQAQLSPLLTAISALDTAANQIIYLTGKDATATTALTELGRKLIAASTAETARQEIGAAADSEVLKIDNYLTEFSTVAEKKQVVDNLGIGDVLTESNSVYRKSGEMYRFNGNNSWGWNFFGDNNSESLTQYNTTGQMQYSSWAISVNPAGGAFKDWESRGTGLLVSCRNTLTAATSVWKAVEWGKSWLVGVDVHCPANGITTMLTHVGTREFIWNSSGDFIMPGTLNCGYVVQTSDKNRKHDIEDIVDSDEIVKSWTGKTFKLDINDRPSAGIIAQDVAKKFPVAVTVLPDGSLGVDYSALQAPMIESMKKRITNEAAMLKRIEELEARLNALSKES